MADTEDEFVEKFESERSNDGYGLVMDKGAAERQEMAGEFDDAPDIGTMDGDGDSGDDAEDFASEIAPQSAPESSQVEVGAPMEAASIEVAELPPLKGSATASAATAQKQPALSFGEAFKAARAAGKKDFSWTNPKTGKAQTFTTKLKSEAARPKAMSAPATDQPEESAASKPLPDAAPPQAALVQKESTNGIGPRLSPAMQPKPGAHGIYEGAAIGPNTRKQVSEAIDRAKNAKATPMTVTGEGGEQRPARSVAELMAARKASGG